MMAFVQARMGSRRLPGKVLRALNGAPMLQYLLESLARAKTLAKTVVLTSNDASDNPIQAFCEAAGTPCFRGELHDVTARFLAAAAAYSAEAFVRISGDSPLMDYRIVDRVVRLFREAPCDLATNVFVRTYPKGQSVEVIARSALKRAYDAMGDADDREHVTKYFYRNPEQFVIRDFRYDRDCGTVPMAVDTQDDFARVEACLRTIGKAPWDATLEEMLRVF